MIHEIVGLCKLKESDLRNISYGTQMYGRRSAMDGIYVTFRNVRFRGTNSIMLHTIEADEPGSGAWKRFWQTVIDIKAYVLQEGFRYIIIDCIMDDRFEKHIEKTWELVKAGELPDPSTLFSTYCFDLERQV